jgi:hypothetical protein
MKNLNLDFTLVEAIDAGDDFLDFEVPIAGVYYLLS